MKKIKDRVRKIRKDNNLTQKQLGKLAGVWSTHISMIERGMRVPSKPVLIALAAKLDVDEDWLIHG